MNCSERISEKAGEQKINMEKKKGCVTKRELPGPWGMRCPPTMVAVEDQSYLDFWFYQIPPGGHR